MESKLDKAGGESWGGGKKKKKQTEKKTGENYRLHSNTPTTNKSKRRGRGGEKSKKGKRPGG